MSSLRISPVCLDVGPVLFTASANSPPPLRRPSSSPGLRMPCESPALRETGRWSGSRREGHRRVVVNSHDRFGGAGGRRCDVGASLLARGCSLMCSVVISVATVAPTLAPTDASRRA